MVVQSSAMQINFILNRDAVLNLKKWSQAEGLTERKA